MSHINSYLQIDKRMYVSTITFYKWIDFQVMKLS